MTHLCPSCDQPCALKLSAFVFKGQPQKVRPMIAECVNCNHKELVHDDPPPHLSGLMTKASGPQT